MWVRGELKDRAKGILKLYYWKAVLVSFILAVIAGGSSGGSSSGSSNAATGRAVKKSIESSGGFEYFLIIISGFIAFILVAVIAFLLIKIFIFNPLEIGARRFFIVSRVGQPELLELGYGFNKAYKNVVMVQFMRGFFTFLWFCVLIVPGIVKAYEYRMIPYILAENPDLSSSEAFRISKEMMNGEKWNAFILDLSFIGWDILGIFTCGMLNIFYVNPYRDLTNAELYAALKNNFLRTTEKRI